MELDSVSGLEKKAWDLVASLRPRFVSARTSVCSTKSWRRHRSHPSPFFPVALICSRVIHWKVDESCVCWPHWQPEGLAGERGSSNPELRI